LPFSARKAYMADHNAYTDYTPLQRLALLAWWLAQGAVITTGRAAVVLGVTLPEAQNQLTNLIAVLPIAAECDRWQRVTTAPMQVTPVTLDEQAALLAWLLALGGVLSNAAAGALIGTGSRQARRILERLALALPVYSAAGLWRSCDDAAPVAYTVADGRCFYCGSVETLTTGVLGGVAVYWCARCEGVYRALRGAR
jgi:hypothetical protein